MARKHTLEPEFHAARNRWKLDIPATVSATGKRLRIWFKTRADARSYVSEITDRENPAVAIQPALAMKADEARALLEPFGLDLVQAAREMVAALKALDGTGSLLDAAKAFRASHVARTASKALGDAVTAYLNARQHLRPRTLQSYRYTLETILESLHGEVMSDIQSAAIESLLEGKGVTSRALHLRNLGCFWRWACKPPRQWATTEVFEALEAPNASNDADIEILKPSEALALLRAAEMEGPAAAAAYSIALFGGVRMAELERLTWASVGEEYIEIGKSVAKKHARRLVPICPTLRVWLDATRGNAKDTDSIVTANWIDVSKSVRRRAGWSVVARLLSAEFQSEEPTRGPWPTNVCRHTCASVQVAIGTPLDDLTFKFGHSGGHDMLRRHYVSRLTKTDALAILAIGPKGLRVPNLSAA